MGLSQFAELSDDELVALFSISAMKSPYGIDEAAHGKEVPTGGFMEGLGFYYTRLYVLLKESVGDFDFTDSQGNRVRAFTNHVFDEDSGEYIERAAWGNNPKQYLYETYGVVGKFETREQIEDYILHTGTVPLPSDVNKAAMDAETIAYYDLTFKAAAQKASVGVLLTMAGSGKGSLKKVGSKIKAGAAKGYVASSKVFKDWVASVRTKPISNTSSYSTKEGSFSADAPYVHRVDTDYPGRPDPKYSLDSTTFSSPVGYNAKGYPRDAGEFWRQWKEMYPDSLSDSNKYLIENYGKLKVSPRIDDVWIKAFPEHGGYMNDVLIHHHVDHGRYTIPVPGKTHPGSGGTWHKK